MKILYFSTSIIPSSFANSINVMKMCSSFVSVGNEVTLVCERGGKQDPFKVYGVKNRFNIVYSTGKIGAIARLKNIFKHRHYDLIYTRYALAAFFYGIVFRKRVIFEHHSFLTGLNSLLEKAIFSSNKIAHVFITKSLQRHYAERIKKLNKRKTAVFPDGADDPDVGVSLVKKLTCGYIGSFQKGKGVELVLSIAERLPNIDFLIIGGDENQISIYKKSKPLENVYWYGHLDHDEAMKILLSDVRIALLPNQKKVMVGKKNKDDIGKWTSPLKMFEYMSYGKAIIASDLQAIKEILVDKHNSYLANPEDADEWATIISKLIQNDDELLRIMNNAYSEFKQNYTWKKRAEKILESLIS